MTRPDTAPVPETANAPEHPISVVAARTGLSRDVLRVWERRYGAVEPGRSAGGQRLYSDEDVRRFRLLASATAHGRAIRQVAQLSTDELARMAAEDGAFAEERTSARGVQEEAVSLADAVRDALRCVLALDAHGLDARLRLAMAQGGTLWFIERLVPALMQEIGEGWTRGRITIAQEHLASAAVMAIVLGIPRGFPTPPGAPRLLVATPSGETHAIGAALAAAAAAIEGWTVVYLGVDVPAADIALAAKASRVRVVALSVVHVADGPAVAKHLVTLRASLAPEVPLLVGGADAAAATDRLGGKGVTILRSIAGLREALRAARDAPGGVREPAE